MTRPTLAREHRRLILIAALFELAVIIAVIVVVIIRARSR